MKTTNKIGILVLLMLFVATNVWAQNEVNDEQRAANAKHPQMTLNDGFSELKRGEYIIIDTKGSVTRSLCPYSCEDRGLAKANCRSWPSIQNPSQCYVMDTRIKTDVFANNK